MRRSSTCENPRLHMKRKKYEEVTLHRPQMRAASAVTCRLSRLPGAEPRASQRAQRSHRMTPGFPRSCFCGVGTELVMKVHASVCRNLASLSKTSATSAVMTSPAVVSIRELLQVGHVSTELAVPVPRTFHPSPANVLFLLSFGVSNHFIRGLLESCPI